MNKTSITVAVTGLNAIDSPGPGVSVIRALRESGFFQIRIIGLAYEAMEPGVYMENIADTSYLIPYPNSGTEALMQRLQYIHQKEKIDVIIPNFDAELFSFIKLQPLLKQLGIHMFLPTEYQFEERQKVKLSEFGEKHSIDVPESKPVVNEKELRKVIDSMKYPVVVKGKFYEAYIAFTIEQAIEYYRKLVFKWGYPVVLQKYIKGSELNVIGLGDGFGNTISAVAMRKQFITDKGKAWAGITITDSNLLEITRKFVKSTKWQGPFELEIMKSEDGIYYLMEINPRIPAWVYLAVGAGHNIPEAIVKLAIGNQVQEMGGYEAGLMFIRYSYDMIVKRENFELFTINGELDKK